MFRASNFYQLQLEGFYTPLAGYLRRTEMTNYEANNPSSLPQSAPVNHSWQWLSARVSGRGTEYLDSWLQGELDQLETSYADLVTERSRKRHLRHEFASSRRSSQ